MIERRDFLKGALTVGGLSLGLRGLANRLALPESDWARGVANQSGGYGPLNPTKAKNSGRTLLALPDGFEYVEFGATGSRMTDGLVTPGAHDGMATFDYGNDIRLVRNHEVRGDPGKPIGPKAYDPKGKGGTTTLIVDAKSRELKESWVSLSGTMVNCAGGPTPWGSWVTCEETLVGPEQGFDRHHGYCFEVPSSKGAASEAVPLKDMGRFVHEAIAVDPSTGIVYLTEDTGAAGFFRFIPNVPGKLAQGGKLQMMTVDGKPKYDTRRNQVRGQRMDAGWVDVDPEGSCYQFGLRKGAATFARLEGCWYGDGEIYLNSTSGGDRGLGQVWRYTPGSDGGSITLLFESPNRAVLKSPDNLCVSPRGGLVLCEDSDDAYLRGLTEDGKIFDLTRNILNDSEFAGATFSPDGETLFCNIQYPGVTLAIWGPWSTGRL